MISPFRSQEGQKGQLQSDSTFYYRRCIVRASKQREIGRLTSDFRKNFYFDSFSSAILFHTVSTTDVFSSMATDTISSTSPHRFRLICPSPTPHLSLQHLSETVLLLPFSPILVSQISRRITKRSSTSGSCRQRRRRNWRRRGKGESWSWGGKNE